MPSYCIGRHFCGRQAVPACAYPVAAFQKLISGKYKLRIVWDLKGGALRYSESETACCAAPVAAAR